MPDEPRTIVLIGSFDHLHHRSLAEAVQICQRAVEERRVMALCEDIEENRRLLGAEIVFGMNRRLEEIIVTAAVEVLARKMIDLEPFPRICREAPMKDWEQRQASRHRRKKKHR